LNAPEKCAALPETRVDTFQHWFLRPWPWLRKSVQRKRKPTIVATRASSTSFSGGKLLDRVADDPGAKPQAQKLDLFARGFQGSKFIDFILERHT
jgi:hypothetical protein